MPPPSRGEYLGLTAVLALAFALRVLVPALQPTIHHPDEVFQYLEQGHRLAFGYGVVPWEYREGTRSWLVPGFLGALMGLTRWLGGGAAAYLLVIAGVLSALSLSIVVVAWLWARRLIGGSAAILAAAIAATWFELVYFGAKPLTEAVAASTLFAATYFLWGTASPRRSALLGAGLLLGLTFVLRIHLSPAIVVIAIAGLFRAPTKSWLVVAGGAAAIVAAAGALDWATWGYPFFSFWKNFQVNVLLGKASHFGTSAWYWYIGEYVRVWSGFLVPLALLVLAGARRVPLLLVVPVVIVASHMVVPHKEFRFVFPAVPFLLLLAALGASELVAVIGRSVPNLKTRPAIAVTIVAWAAVSAVLAVGDRFRPNWSKAGAYLAAMSDLRDRSPVCGVGLVGVPWYYSGGYTYLHRDIPLYIVRGPDDFAALWHSFDTALVTGEASPPEPGYRRERCYFGKVCLFRRNGDCAATPERAINADLRHRDD